MSRRSTPPDDPSHLIQGDAPRYALAIFDFDGTLADSQHLFVEALTVAADRHGFTRPDPARMLHYRALAPRALLAELGIPLWKLPRVTALLRSIMREQIARVPLFAGTGELLATLRRHGVRTALVTSNTQPSVERVLGPKYTAMIDRAVYDVSLLGKRRHLRDTLTGFGVVRARALYIGDEVRDAEAAAGVGIDFIGVPWGYALPEVLAPHSRHPLPRDFAQLAEYIVRGA